MYPYLAEFLGTTIFIFLGLSVNASNNLQGSYFKNAGPLFIIFGWGIAYSMTALCFFKISGAYFNPVIPFSLACVGLFSWIEIPGYFLAEFLGAFLGALLMYLFYKDQFDATDSPATILSCFASDAAIANMGLNLFCEIIVTFIFSFFNVVIILSISKYAYIFAGIILGMVANTLGGTTQFAVNPAADLMPRIAHQILPIPNKKNSNWGYAIIPVLGPFIGAPLGALLAIFTVQVQTLI